MENIQVKILDSRIGASEEFPLPQAATEGSAAIDLRACIDKDVVVVAGEVLMIGTGLAMYIANPNFAGMILPRSGIGHKSGIVLGNLVGLIDADYQGELKISVWNRSDHDFTIKPGDRIAQYVIVPIVRPTLKIVDDFVGSSERGDSGFGSTGTA